MKLQLHHANSERSTLYKASGLDFFSFNVLIENCNCRYRVAVSDITTAVKEGAYVCRILKLVSR